MDETLNMVLRTIMSVLIIGCVPVIITYGLKIANKKIDEIQTNISLSKYTKLNKYIDIAQSAITTAVTSVSQTYVDSLKKSGTFDETAQAIAKDKAIEVAKKLITDDTANAISTLFGDFETYLDNSIEEIVNKTK